MLGWRRALFSSRNGLNSRSLAPRRGLKLSNTTFRSLSACQRVGMGKSWKSLHFNYNLKHYEVSCRFLTSGKDLPPHSEVTLPALSPTMEQGSLVKWEKQIGDELEEGDIIAQIETDKATMDMETPSTGYLATILVPEGSKDLPLGMLLAVIVENKDDIAAFKDFKPSSDTPSPPPTPPSAPEPVSPQIDLPPHSEVTLPALSPTMEQGSLVKWEKQIGDELEEGDIIAQIETDKATMDMETPSTGYLATILVPEGSKDLPLGKLLAIIVENKEDIDSFKNYVPSAPLPSQQSPSQPSPPPQPSQSIPPTYKQSIPTPQQTTPTTISGRRVLASPYAKTIATEKGIDLQLVQGTGPSGRVIAKDVLQSVGQPGIVIPTPGTTYEDISLTGMRKTIAARLLLSKQTIPHYYISVDINMEDVLRLRKQINSDNDNIKLSVNDFIIKASALSMKHIPEVNSSWMETFIRRYNTVDICIAVSTEGGLITPIIPNADIKGLQTISSEVKELAEKARMGKLQPHEFQGGTFTISNLGMFGIRNFAAVINPPQACILAVGTTEKRLIVDEESDKGYRPAPIMSVTMSCDHRVVDGAVGAQWLSVFRSYLEKPFKMLI